MKQYLHVGTEDYDIVEKLGAQWDAIENKWFFDKEEDYDKFKKWIFSDVQNIFPDLSDYFHEPIKYGRQKYYLMFGQKGKRIVAEFSSENHIFCNCYTLSPTWICKDCSTWLENIAKNIPQEELNNMSMVHFNELSEKNIRLCQQEHLYDTQCHPAESSVMTDIRGFINSFPIIGEGGSKLIYLGQFISLEKCRKYVKRFDIE
jgi:hypothetical protein